MCQSDYENYSASVREDLFDFEDESVVRTVRFSNTETPIARTVLLMCYLKPFRAFLERQTSNKKTSVLQWLSKVSNQVVYTADVEVSIKTTTQLPIPAVGSEGEVL
jgi:hypothetical protein